MKIQLVIKFKKSLLFFSSNSLVFFRLYANFIKSFDMIALENFLFTCMCLLATSLVDAEEEIGSPLRIAQCRAHCIMKVSNSFLDLFIKKTNLTRVVIIFQKYFSRPFTV